MSEPLHQIYCTHCTYQTAFLEQRGGDMADRPLGYAARASSMPAEHLRRQYRNIERLLSYKLPSDATPESRTEHDAHTAPQRFFYHPSLSGNQIVGTICYRTWDAANKSAGAYFAHLVLQKNTDPWDPLEVLKRWNSPTWVREDDRDHPHDLAELKNLQEIEKSMHPLLNDEGFHDFLTQADLSSPDRSSIPERWRKMPLEKRQQYFTLALRGYLQSLGGRRPGILLVAEPEIAVVFFYGILRLLPRGMLKELSFSTYETALADRFIHLAATTLIDPANDIPPDIYKRGCVINTFSGESSFVKKAGDDYTALILEKLVVSLQAADPIIKEMATLNVSTPETLNQLADADRKVQALISDNASELPAQPARNNQQKKYIAARLRKKLQLLAKKETWENDADRLLQILDYVATQGPGTRNIKAPPTEEERHIDKLVKAIPDAQLAQFIHSNEVGAAYKTFALENYVQRLHHLPRECEKYLWQDLSNSSLLHDLLQRLPTQEWINLWGHYAPTADIRFLQLLLEISKLTSSSHETTLPEQDARAYFLSNIIRQQKDEHLITLLKQSAKLKALHSIIGGALTERINALIEDVKSSSNIKTAEKIRIIRKCDFLLDARGKAFAARLQKISNTFNDIKDKTGANRKLFKKPKISEELELAKLHHELAKCLQEALTPLEKPDAKKLITARQCIHLLQATLEVDGGDFGIIDKGFAQDLQLFLKLSNNKDWPKTLGLNLPESNQHKDKKNKRTLIITFVATACFTVIVVVAGYYSFESASDGVPKKGEKPSTSKSVQTANQTEIPEDNETDADHPLPGQKTLDNFKKEIGQTAESPPNTNIPLGPEDEKQASANATTDVRPLDQEANGATELDTQQPSTTSTNSQATEGTAAADLSDPVKIPPEPPEPVILTATLPNSYPTSDEIKWGIREGVSRIEIPEWSINPIAAAATETPNLRWEQLESELGGNLYNNQTLIASVSYDNKEPATITLKKEMPNTASTKGDALPFFNDYVLSIVAFDRNKLMDALTYLPSPFITHDADGSNNTPYIQKFNSRKVATFRLPLGTPATITTLNEPAYLIITKESKMEKFSIPLENINADAINIDINLHDKYTDLGISSAKITFTREASPDRLRAKLHGLSEVAERNELKEKIKQLDANIETERKAFTKKLKALKTDATSQEAQLQRHYLNLKSYKDLKTVVMQIQTLVPEIEKYPKEIPINKDRPEFKKWKKKAIEQLKPQFNWKESETNQRLSSEIKTNNQRLRKVEDLLKLTIEIRLPSLYGVEEWKQHNATIYIPLITDGKEPKSIPQSHAADGSIDDESSKELPATENPHKEHQEKGGNEHPTVNETGDSSKDSLEPSDPHTDS